MFTDNDYWETAPIYTKRGATTSPIAQGSYWCALLLDVEEGVAGSSLDLLVKTVAAFVLQSSSCV